MGSGFTVTFTLAVLVHPLPSVPITVYAVVEVGVAETADPVFEESPDAGLHA